MEQYTRFQTANAIGDAANNPGGIAGIGAGLGAGVVMANQMAGALHGGQAAGQTQPPPVSPPPLPTASAFFIALNGVQSGPFDLDTLTNRAREGSFTRSTLVWKQGMPNWTPAETVPELQRVFGAVPPPLPPPLPR
jgi:hypothetical protein